MSRAKVSQEQADAYLNGWTSRHNGQAMKEAFEECHTPDNFDLKKRFAEGYEDCDLGKLNFDKMMGPNDFEPQLP